MESAVLGTGECLVTTQKAVEEPIVSQEESHEPLRDEDGNLVDREGNIIPTAPNGEPINPEDQERVVHVPTGEFQDVIREVEIINVISACAQEGTDPRTGEVRLGARAHVQTFIVECHKAANLGHANCHTRRGGFEGRQPGPFVGSPGLG